MKNEGAGNNIDWTQHEKVGPNGRGVELWRYPRCGDRVSEVKIMIMFMMMDGGSHDGDHDGDHSGDDDGDHDGDHHGGHGSNSNDSTTIQQ